MAKKWAFYRHYLIRDGHLACSDRRFVRVGGRPQRAEIQRRSPQPLFERHVGRPSNRWRFRRQRNWRRRRQRNRRRRQQNRRRRNRWRRPMVSFVRRPRSGVRRRRRRRLSEHFSPAGGRVPDGWRPTNEAHQTAVENKRRRRRPLAPRG